ncbi:MAG: 16S rRNA (cytosine(1402)-N(4))-methyltransferase RsmH [Acidobacteria bacterium]|nr:16S rRNA (cytosine(1402)-N(4))-methyltransferase RsmH [Acidobacteriota bacterium]MSO61977.1 16S rRNA (cytosine(1402)-N(4))-methyltransferase RsmH [Acidobacteriota bacterium]
MERATHVPVLLDEVRSLLQPERGGTFVDCTVGLGGHSRMLLESGATRLIAIDRDTDAIAIAKVELDAFADRVTFVHADYREVADVLAAQGVSEIAGLLADFGVSSMQLDADGRGFSFRRDEPLDMRMDRSQGETAVELIDRVDETELADVIYRFGEERRSRQVARAIVMARQQSPIATTGRLAEVVRRGVAARGWQRIDPATRTFQALRIWVNRELDELDAFIGRAASRLQVGGRLALISFHSLEDRVVKHTLRDLARGDAAAIKVLTKHPVVAGDAEAAVNPRARSAKLRAAVRVRQGRGDG